MTKTNFGITKKAGEETEMASSSGVYLTQDQFDQLLKMKQPTQPTRHNFTKCTQRFNGERSHAKVEEFITVISIYKDIEQISDQDALTALPLLFTDKASVWWAGVKAENKTWESALVSIREAFAPKRQASDIFVEFFSNSQGEEEDIDTFVCRKRQLIAQLPAKRFSQEDEIDLVYGLINVDLRKKIPRPDIATFSDLLHKARHIEQLEMETKGIKKRERCAYCGKIGHITELCRKRLAKMTTKASEIPNRAGPSKVAPTATPTPQAESHIKCYGCGAPGVFRSQCLTCKNKDSPPKKLQFYAVTSNVQHAAKVPTIEIMYEGNTGNAYIDTAARTSIAGMRLYALMLKKGVKFTESLSVVDLADGSSKLRRILTASVNITVGNRDVPITFTVLPDANDNRTLLGIDFLEDNAIVLHLAQRMWFFADEPKKTFEFIRIPNEPPGEPRKRKHCRVL